MTGAAGLGPWPGTDPLEAQQAVLDVLGNAPSGVDGLPCLVRLPARGPGGGAVGRTLAILEGMPAGLEPHGWRLRPNADAELRRARSLVRDDLEALSIAAHGYTGRLVVPVLGPWSLAANVWLPKGERAVADPVAVRDVVDSLVAGVAEHLADLGRRVPGAVPVVLVAEPALADVLVGAVPTFSGRARLAAVEGVVVRERLRVLVAGLREAAGSGGAVVVHVPADPATVRLGAAVGADGLGLDVTAAGSDVWEELAAAVEAGATPWAGAVRPEREAPAGARSEASAAADVVEKAWRAVGLERRRLADVVVTPTAGLAAVSPARAREALRAVVDAARDLGERSGS